MALIPPPKRGKFYSTNELEEIVSRIDSYIEFEQDLKNDNEEMYHNFEEELQPTDELKIPSPTPTSLLAFFALLALVNAAPGLYPTSLLKAEVVHDPNYSFGYEVRDPHTGDFKDQFETRKGDVVQGRYSVLDADGTKRTVNYAADAFSGFNAVVSKTPAVVPAAKIETISAVAPVAKIEAVAPVAKIETVAPIANIETLPTFIHHAEPTIARLAYSPYLESHHLFGGLHPSLTTLIL
ncbi:hypothetical protein RN001_004664 [Aquatica leii]|uniref:Cuticle protein n=1 Tax=Aquatica leii TaxID=1421715 RepID=A0AAN7Q604_9COLE|nr:hypothetical protein RN001_004664 [Aquatica leii]